MKPEVDLAIGELVKHGVLHKDEIDSAFEKYPEAASIDDRDALGDFLEQIGLITAFQAGELRNKRIADLAMANYLILDRLGEGGMGTVFRVMPDGMMTTVPIQLWPRLTCLFGWMKYVSLQFSDFFDCQIDLFGALHVYISKY